MKISSNVKGVSFLVLAILIASLQNIAVKWIGREYPVLEIVVFRSLVALPCTLLFFRLEGRRGWPTARQLRLEYVRGFLFFLSNTAFFMGLAALPMCV